MNGNLSGKTIFLFLIILFLLGWTTMAVNALYDFQSQKQTIEKNIQQNIEDSIKLDHNY